MRHLPFLSILLLIAAGSTGLAQGGGAQQGRLIPLNGVAAIVGTEVILIGDVYEQANRLAAQTRINPQDPRVLTEVLQALINEKLVLTRSAVEAIQARFEGEAA